MLYPSTTILPFCRLLLPQYLVPCSKAVYFVDLIKVWFESHIHFHLSGFMYGFAAYCSVCSLSRRIAAFSTMKINGTLPTHHSSHPLPFSATPDAFLSIYDIKSVIRSPDIPNHQVKCCSNIFVEACCVCPDLAAFYYDVVVRSPLFQRATYILAL